MGDVATGVAAEVTDGSGWLRALMEVAAVDAVVETEVAAEVADGSGRRQRAPRGGRERRRRRATEAVLAV